MSEKKYTSIKHDAAAGRVEFQSGKAIWQWSGEQGESTSILLKRLDNPELELERTRKMAIARKAEASKAEGKTPAVAEKAKSRSTDLLDFETDIRAGLGGPSAGFDPYNNG
jgi:hypothetical protein